ncbi:hypothetical protein BKA64DRAFT_699467 [Cadophora sp. MPI-SDFR-AT-0126]|nr:hypothetical protein BKA64DRAFT_699467 [Leotiomycetes sp. MPI-SDFR-AT-0126]
MYCVSCTTAGCLSAICHEHPTCWQQHVNHDIAHLRDTHKIIDPFPSLFVEAATHSEKDKAILKRLHEEDRFARWFSVKLGGEDPELWLYDRFIRLCDPARTGNRATENHYPSFVSFVGDTSVGKSTIVRAMLLLGLFESSANLRDFTNHAHSTHDLDLIAWAHNKGCSMPVPRSGNFDHKTDPTTFGVHLYHDDSTVMHRNGSPQSEQPSREGSHSKHFPLLFADCEGFGAGTATTLALRLAELNEDDDASIEKLPITAPCYSTGSKNGIDLFYARVLYAISDVIVFVTKGDQTIKPDLIRVLEWASAAVKKSYNQPSRKTLIIARNMETTTEAYTNESLKQKYLYSFGTEKLWADSTILNSFVEDHNRFVHPHSAIWDNDQLYKALFQDIKCCYVPHKGLDSNASPERSTDMFEHLKALRKQIEYSVNDERRIRSRGFSHYNVPALNHILVQVFEHFRTSEDPLNFFLAARRDNPTPHNIPGHIANFLRLVLESTEDRTPGIKDMTVSAISLMCLIYANRWQDVLSNPLILDPEDMFDHELRKFWDEGLELYLAQYEKCTYPFVARDGSVIYCNIRGRNQHKMHVYTPSSGISGPQRCLEAQGEFLYRRSWSPAAQEAWRTVIKKRFQHMYHQAFNESESSSKPRQRILEIRKQIYSTHYSAWGQLRSNKTCLSCYQSVPDHVLPCGHSYCPCCVQELANVSRSFECAFDMPACILCGTHNPANPHQIRLKPRCAGARILTLDGGGIRGIVELALVKAIEREVGINIEIGEMFDLIVGTSTGGIVALALGMVPRTPENTFDAMVNFFEEAAKNTFVHSRAGFDIGTKVLMLLGRYESKYSSEPLKAALIDFFGDKTSLFAPAKSRNVQSTTRVAVTTARDEGGTEYLIANYNRPQGKWSRFEREDDVNKDMKIWEAALATSAAPFYLPPFKRDHGGADFVDGAVYANCPAKVAMEEKENLWPDGATSLDILLSLGTGHQVKVKPRIMKAFRYGAFKPLLKMFERQMNTEGNWNEVVRTTPTNIRSRLHRLNPSIKAKGELGGYVDIDDEKEIEHLFRSVSDWTKNAGLTSIQHISNVLIANLFFFEPDPECLPSEKATTLSGDIRCRLQHDSKVLHKLLATKTSAFWHATVTRTEVARLESLAENRWRLLKNRREATTEPARMIIEDEGIKKFRLKFEVPCVQTGSTYQVLAIQLAGVPMKIAISGFPATLEELGERSRCQWLQ